MAHDCDISHAVKLAQETMFRVAAKNGQSLKAISMDSKIPYSTLRTYAGNNGPTSEMPISALRKLTGVLSDELLSLLMVEGVQLLHAPDCIDHDALCEIAEDYVKTKMAAHRADSPAGPAICPESEQPVLDGKAARLKVAK